MPANYQNKVYQEKDRLAVQSGGEIDVETGGALKFNAVDKTAILAASVANQVASTSTAKKIIGASYTVVAGDDTAGTKTIATGVTIITALVQILRAGVDVTADAEISWSAGNLVVDDGAATYALTAGDLINWIAFGS